MREFAFASVLMYKLIFSKPLLKEVQIPVPIFKEFSMQINLVLLHSLFRRNPMIVSGFMLPGFWQSPHLRVVDLFPCRELSC